MADGSVSPKARHSAPRELYSLNGSYDIREGVKSEALAADASAMLSGTLALLQALADGVSDEDSQLQANPKDIVSLLYLAIQQVQMAGNLASAASAHRKMGLPEVLAAALELEGQDASVVERFLRAKITAGLNLDAESVRKCPAEQLRAMTG